MTDDRRRTLRRILMWGFAPLALVGAVVSTKLISVNAFSDAAVSAFDRRSWNEAQQQARGLEWWNWIETWKAPFDIAVAIGMLGDANEDPEQLQQARALLEHALELQGDPESNEYCVITTNIVYVVEMQGDIARGAGDVETANGLYQEALELIDQAPEGCMEEPDPGDANTQEQLEASVPRIEDKIEDSGGEDGEEDGDPEDDQEGDPEDGEPQDPEDEDQGDSQQEQLEDQNQQAQEDQQAQDEYYDQQGEDGEGGGVDQPW